MSDPIRVDPPRTETPAPLLLRARRLAIAGGAYALLGGLLSFCGWAFDLRRLTDWNDAGISIQPNTALTAAAAGAGLLLILFERRRAAAALGLLVAAVGATIWLQNATGFDAGIDRLFLFGRTWGNTGVLSPGRIPPASVSWMLLGLGLVFAGRGMRARGSVAPLAGIALGIGLLSIVGHLYGADLLYTVPHLTMIAMQTGTFIFAVASGLILSLPERAPTLWLLAGDASGTLLRRALWAVVLLPVLVGRLQLVGQERGAYDLAFGTAARTLAEIVVMTGLLFWTAAAIRRQTRLAAQQAGAARASEARLTGLLGTINDGFMIFDRDWRITFVNAESLRRMERTQAETLGKVLWDVYLADSTGGEVAGQLRRAMRERRRVEFETFYAPHGRWYFGRVYPMADGGLAVFSRDVTERKKVEQQLREQAHLLDLSTDTIFVRDAQNRITYWNRGAESLYGYAREEALGKTSDALLKTLFPEPRERIWETLRRGQRWEGELIHTSKDGRRVIVASRWILHRDAAGAEWILETNTDMTERKQIERERVRLLHAERGARAEAERASAIKDEFLATLSHELRTPLNAILGWVRVLEKRAADPAMVAEGIAVIARNAKAQSDLIADLLDMNRIMSGRIRLEREDLDLPAVARDAIDAIRPAADAKQLRLELIAHPVGDGARGDPGRVQQILWNLLSNAVKFTPKGGLIQVTLRQDGPAARIEVRDTGNGIAAQLLPHVFDRFRQGDASTTREHGGLGLGLAIVKQLVELHGGSVRAESPGPGQGATFTVELPLAREEAAASGAVAEVPSAAAAAPAPAGAEIDLSGITVLAVDDQPDARELMRIVLESRHARVFTAGSADEALGLLSAASPDIILCDIAMPGLDGYGFIRLVRQRDDGTPALAVSAFARTEDRARALRAGYQAHIAKPVEPEELVSTVAVLARSAGAGSVQGG
jgi:PAS domain S-box-containing protein